MSDKALNSEIELLQRQLQEANDKIKAIQDGSGQPFRLLVETMQQGAATLCAEGKIAYSNQSLATLLGEPQEKLVGRCLAEFVKSEDRALFRQVFLQGLQGNGSVEIELQLSDGTLNPVLISLNVLPSDVPAAVGALITDLKGQKLQDELTTTVDTLRANEFQFHQLADSIPQLAWTASPDGNIDWFNQRWYEYTATTLEEMQGWGWQSIHDPAVLPKVVEEWKHSLDTGEPFEMTFPLRGADGVYRPFLTRVTPVRDAEGHIVRWFGTNTDISKERESQRELETIAAQLSDSDRRKDQFLATLAHELRNPLSPIKTAAQLMQRVDDPSQLRELSEVIDRQVIQMVRLIDDLMDVSRISRGKVRLRLEHCDLREVVKSAVEAVSPAIENAHHTLQVDIPDSPLRVNGDKARLVQILANLLNNAVKYTTSGGEIVLTARQENDKALLQVRDNGIGLSEDKLKVIFEMFEQVEEANERGQSGLGIGLSLAQSLVQLHEGQLTAASAGLGCGSTFNIRLPLLTDLPQSTVKEPTAEKRSSPTRPFRVLVVEDTRTIRFMIVRLLTTMGHEVAEAADGEQALEVATEFKPEVIFSDISMPVMNGYELARQIRASDRFDGVQMVALTGYGQETDRKNALDAGFNDHIVKPVDVSVLTNFFTTLSGNSH